MRNITINKETKEEWADEITHCREALFANETSSPWIYCCDRLTLPGSLRQVGDCPQGLREPYGWLNRRPLQAEPHRGLCSASRLVERPGSSSQATRVSRTCAYNGTGRSLPTLPFVTHLPCSILPLLHACARTHVQAGEHSRT